jgi:hypothetical protein
VVRREAQYSAALGRTYLGQKTNRRGLQGQGTLPFTARSSCHTIYDEGFEKTAWTPKQAESSSQKIGHNSNFFDINFTNFMRKIFTHLMRKTR